MIVPSRVAIPLAFLVALLTVTVVFNAGIAQAPREFFGAREDILLLLPGTGEVTSTGTVPESLATVLRTREDVTMVSAEVMLMTTIGDRSVFARGVVAEDFLAMEGAPLVDGEMPRSMQDALVGEGLARALDLEVGSRILVTGSLREQAAIVRIAGIFGTRDFTRDELLLALPVARGLADLSPEGVHLIRVRATDAGEVARLTSAVQPTFTYSDVSISDSDTLVGQPVVVRGNVTNWGVLAGTKQILVHAEEEVVGRGSAYVPPRSTVPFAVPVTLHGLGSVNITINPTFEVIVRPPVAQFGPMAPVMTVGAASEVRLLRMDGSPFPAAVVRLGDASNTTDAEGRTVLTPDSEGEAALTASDAGGIIASQRVFVVSQEHAGVSHGRIVSIDTESGLVGTADDVELNVTLLNAGGVTGEVRGTVLMEGGASHVVAATLAPGQQARVSVPVGRLPAGLHTFRAEDGSGSLVIESYPGDARVEAALRAIEVARSNPSATPRVGQDADDYVGRIVRNVALAATALTLAAGTLTSLAILAVWSRHLSERTPQIGVLKSLGASREQVLSIVGREALVQAAVAAGAGLLAGVVLALAIHATGFVRAFGHRVAPSIEAWQLVVLASVTILVNVLIARAIAGRTYRIQAADLIARPRVGGQEQPTLAERLEGA